jgi:hypothetical protein
MPAISVFINVQFLFSGESYAIDGSEFEMVHIQIRAQRNWKHFAIMKVDEINLAIDNSDAGSRKKSRVFLLWVGSFP